MPFAEHGNLQTFLKKNKEKCKLQIYSILKQCAIGVHVLNQAGVLHFDLKLKNYLVFDETPLIKLADFGCSIYPIKTPKVKIFYVINNYFSGI